MSIRARFGTLLSIVSSRRGVLLLGLLLLLRLVQKTMHAARTSFTKIHLNPADDRMRRLFGAVRALDDGYVPTWWCCSMWLNVVVMVIKENLTALLRPMRMHRQLIQRPDGGLVSLDWADDEVTRKLPVDAPVMGILHTVCGKSSDQAGFMRLAAGRGWRAVVMNRRGHSGMALLTPNFSLIGNTQDSLAMVNEIKRSYPAAYIGLAGISAGSGQIVSFIGDQGAALGPNVAAASLCPSYDISKSFHYLQQRFPLVDRVVTHTCKQFFLAPQRNQHTLDQMPQAKEKIMQASTLNGFFEAAVPYADGASPAAGDELLTISTYLAAHQPLSAAY